MSRGGGVTIPKPENEDAARREEIRLGGGGWDGHRSYMADKNKKLRTQYGKVPILSNALSGVVVHINGATVVPKHELSEMVTQHGGRYNQYPSAELTHYVTDHVPDAKVAGMLTNLQTKRRAGREYYIVRESWIVESTRQARRLRESDFALAQLCDPQQRRLEETTGPALVTPAGCRGTSDDDGRGVGGCGAGGGDGAGSSSSGAAGAAGAAGASVGGSDGGRLFTPPSASAEMQSPRGDAVGAESHRPAPPATSAASAASAAPPRRVSPLVAAPATAPAAVPGEQRVGVGGLVLHVDVDSFFAQCHQVEEPLKWPRDRPLVVQQHQDVIALTPPAKACGARKKMRPDEARRVLVAAGWDGGCVVHVPVDGVGRVTYRLYTEWSRRLLRLWESLSRAQAATAVLEKHPSSLDEAWIDCGANDPLAALALARKLRAESLAQLGFEVPQSY